jgi:hypothetical protein
MPNQSIRVQMSTETLSELNKLALKYACTYNNEPSLSRLLGQIGDGHLTIEPGTVSKELNTTTPLVLLTLKAPSNLNGIVATVSRKIADAHGKIFQIATVPFNDDLGLLKISLSLDAKNFSQEIKKLKTLISKLRSIKFADIERFNQPDRLMQAYNLMQNFGKSATTNVSMSQYFNMQSPIGDITYSFGMRINACSGIETIASITDLVASKQIFVSKIEHDFDFQQNEDIVNLFLEVRLSDRIDRFEDEMENISRLDELIYNLETVKEVERLGINSWS